jgi:hypothetical protein
MAPRGDVTGLDHDRGDEAGVEFENEAEVGLLRRGLGDPGRDRQGGGGDQILRWIVAMVVFAQQDLLGPLRDHAERQVAHAVAQLRRRGGAAQHEPRQRRGSPIGRDSPRQPLD